MKDFLYGSIAIVVILFGIGSSYYFFISKPAHDAELIKIEREKLEEQKKQEERKQEEKLRQEQEKIDKMYKDTDGYSDCQKKAMDNMNTRLDINIGCDWDTPGAEGKCVVNLNGENGEIAKKIVDDYKKDIEDCKEKYPDADLDLIKYRENPADHPEG